MGDKVASANIYQCKNVKNQIIAAVAGIYIKLNSIRYFLNLIISFFHFFFDPIFFFLYKKRT